MEKREDPDEMLHKAAFHQDLYYLLRQNRSSEKEIIFLESITYITPHYIQCGTVISENSIGLKRGNRCSVHTYMWSVHIHL